MKRRRKFYQDEMKENTGHETITHSTLGAYLDEDGEVQQERLCLKELFYIGINKCFFRKSKKHKFNIHAFLFFKEVSQTRKYVYEFFPMTIYFFFEIHKIVYILNKITLQKDVIMISLSRKKKYIFDIYYLFICVFF
ncbi:LOW QUALITY PROTEIN: hypothetical protein KUTeg_008504 [Tegillarca granosa]|uniref:Uncharacterized protein n=1 Tax=Tegillarca granosa TaxID=220873 RepID=A0ABQ9F9C1_TEGGR|nr:LOW QUALITY PROTEIN: hypothetical protein KUTeg_008504 [Tegillarca granosa]